MDEHNDPLGMFDDLHIPDDLAGLLDGDTGTTETPSAQGAVQVICGIDLAPGSPYVCTVAPTDDVSIELPRERAITYGCVVLAVAMRARYFAAVRAQMLDVLAGRRGNKTTVEASRITETAQMVVGSLAADTPEPDRAATAPLVFQAGINRRTGEPLVHVTLAGADAPLTVWSPADAREHALWVLEGAIIADLDSAYRTQMAGLFELGEPRARAIIADLAGYFNRAEVDTVPKSALKLSPARRGKGKRKRH